MGRPRKFDREEALQKAIEVFWSQGYAATTMTDLQKALGIGRQSLYATFGEKPQIFEEALGSYVAMADAMLDEKFGPDPGVEEIRAHFDFALDGLHNGERMGCLAMNTCVERAPHDPETAKLSTRVLESLQKTFSRALMNGVQRGELAQDLDVNGVASVLVNQSAGLAVLVRAGTPVTELRAIVDTLLDAVLRPQDNP